MNQTPELPNQDAIWNHFQTHGRASFRASSARLGKLARLLRRGSRVLNIGAGGGEFERAGLALGLDVFSLDPSSATIADLRQALDLGDRAQVGRAEAIPFPAEHFDAVVMSEVLEHLDQPTTAKALGEVRRVLRPGGRLLGTVPRAENLAEQHVVCPRCSHQFHRWGHEQSYSEDRLRATLATVLEPSLVEARLFVHWPSLNLKGKLAGAIKLALLAVGVHGANESLLFVATRGGDHRQPRDA